MGNKQFFVSIGFLLIIGGLPSGTLAAKPNPFLGLTSLTIQCSHKSQVSICRKGLLLTEVLQRQAASKGNYSCQSRLLGLGTQLLLISLNPAEEVPISGILKEVGMFCGRL